MENSSHSIFDISSDDEVGFGEPRKVGGKGVGGVGFGDRDDLDWLSELLVEVGGKDDSDDVVLVSETFANPSKKSRFASKTVDDDDDCIVLDGDPDKPVVAEGGNCKVGDGGADDDLEIVGEKGEVACRDFPHARHLCVNFLFASTPHATHCSQCHCYVCDSLAPCSQWGTGVSSIDHCHATDKDEYWKTERKRLKKGEKPAPAFIPRTVPNTSHVRASFQPTTQASSLAPQWSNSQFPQSPMLRPVAPHLSFRPNPPRHVPVIRAPRSQFSHIVKRPGVVQASLSSNSHLNGPPLPTNPLKRCRTIQPSPVSTRPRVMGTRTVRPLLQVNDVGRANHLHPPQPHFQPYVNTTTFVSTSAHLQPHMTPQPSVVRPKTYVPSQNAIGSEVTPRFMSPSNQSVGINNLANQQSSQPQLRGNPNSSLFDMRNDIQKVNNHSQNGIDAYSNDFGLAWDYSSLIPGNVQVQEVVQQSQSGGPVDNSQVQSVVEPVVDNNYQQQGVDNNVSCQFSESLPNGTFDSLFDSLIFENNSLPGVSEVPVSPLWNAYSPEPASLDTSNFFDFLVFGE